MKSFKVIVIGDVMLDRYIIGQHNRQSPEADIPIIDVYNIQDKLGGAGNVANNLKALGSHPILLSAVGEDLAGNKMVKLLEESNIENYLTKDKYRCTTVKTRIVDSKFNQFLRYDEENIESISNTVCSKLIQNLNQLIKEQNIDAIIIQDYNKGLLSIDLITYVQKKCLQSGIKLLVDPKINNFKLLSICDVFKPNFNEISTFLEQLNIEKTPESLIHHLKEKELDYKKLILTLAESGVFYKDDNTSGIIKGKAIEKPDVSGAGDTVIAVLSILILLKFQIRRIAKIVNECGALVCTKKGVSTISMREFQEIINKIA